MTLSTTPRAFIIAMVLIGIFWAPGASAQGFGLSVSVDLAEYENSGVTGGAYLVETTAGGTHVSMELRGEPVDGNHPTHIHTGTCSDFDPEPLYPLETVDLSPVNQEGVSETDIPDVSLGSLRDGEFVIVVHRSPEQLTEYLICGEIGRGSVGQAAKVAPAEGAAVAHHMPTAGVGPDLSNDTQSTLRLTAATLALVFAAGAIVTRIHSARRR